VHGRCKTRKASRGSSGSVARERGSGGLPALGAVIALCGVLATPAGAHMGGMWDCGRPDVPCWAAGYSAFGCTGSSCHGNLAENSTTQIFVNGLPTSYTPGNPYDITVWVVGVPIYTFVDNGCRAFGLLPVDGLNNLAGFHLELAAGTKENPLPNGT